MELTEALDRSYHHAQGVIAGVRPDQQGDPTPCAEWSVKDLLTHLLGVVQQMGMAARGEPARTDIELGADPAVQFADLSASTLAAWQGPGVLDETLDAGGGPMPGRLLASINLIDTTTHAWDLATATGQDATIPDDLAAAAMEASQWVVSAEVRVGRFGPEVGAPEGGSETDRLVAFLGRQPA